MFLSDYIEAIEPLEIMNRRDFPIAGIANNSNDVKPNFIFCAIRGSKNDGRSFLGPALENGAAAVVTDDPCLQVPDATPLLIVQNAYHAWGRLCEAFAEYPARYMQLHAVTGTNGKTTTAFLLRSLISRTQEMNCGLISTIEYDTGGKTPVLEASRTTPDAMSFQKLLQEMRRNGCHAAVMEASSHGLHQRRTGKADFATAIFTNLTGDHLDYHKTMEAYFLAKSYLFTDLIRPGGNAVVNVDDPWGARLAEEIDSRQVRLITLSTQKDAVCRISDIHMKEDGTDFLLHFDGTSIPVSTALIGLHNVYNAASAIAAALALGIPAEKIRNALPDLPAVPGRLEPFRLKTGAMAFVDYAHTDDALERVIAALKPICRKNNGHLICVFGCGGDRDRTKRPRMGAAVARGADLPIVTSDNPRSEDPEKIMDEIFAGIPHEIPAKRIGDRAEAIRTAVEISQKGDIVLIAGKGHENTQEINGIKHPFDDREVVKRFVQ